MSNSNDALKWVLIVLAVLLFLPLVAMLVMMMTGGMGGMMGGMGGGMMGGMVGSMIFMWIAGLLVFSVLILLIVGLAKRIS